MPSVWMGNPQVVETLTLRDRFGKPQTDEVGHETRIRVPAPDSEWTVADLVPGIGVDEFVQALTGGIWPHHSDAPKPTWVASDDFDLAATVAEAFGCPVGPVPDGAYGALNALGVHGTD